MAAHAILTGGHQVADLIQFRRDTAANWTSNNPTLAQGELGLETDTMKYKIGDGSTAWTSLNYIELTGDFTTLSMTGTSASAPASGLNMFVRDIAGRKLPAFIGPAGLDSALQPLLARNKIGYWCPPGNATTVPGVLGFTAPTTVGTATARTVAITNTFTRMRRLGYVSSGTAGSLASRRLSVAQITLGDGSGNGGFTKIIRFGISDASVVSGARTFIGISSSTSTPTNVEPSTLTNVIGMGHGAADTNFKIFYGGSSAQTPIDLGANFPSNTSNTDAYELALFSSPNATGECMYQVTRLNTGDTASGTLTSATPGVTLPATTTLLSYVYDYRSNNATAAAVGLDIMSDYIETDY